MNASKPTKALQIANRFEVEVRSAVPEGITLRSANEKGARCPIAKSGLLLMLKILGCSCLNSFLNVPLDRIAPRVVHS
jgi:hypothetical protein